MFLPPLECLAETALHGHIHHHNPRESNPGLTGSWPEAWVAAPPSNYLDASLGLHARFPVRDHGTQGNQWEPQGPDWRDIKLSHFLQSFVPVTLLLVFLLWASVPDSGTPAPVLDLLVLNLCIVIVLLQPQTVLPCLCLAPVLPLSYALLWSHFCLKTSSLYCVMCWISWLLTYYLSLDIDSHDLLAQALRVNLTPATVTLNLASGPTVL